jgi:hypothetical protein
VVRSEMTDFVFPLLSSLLERKCGETYVGSLLVSL